MKQQAALEENLWSFGGGKKFFAAAQKKIQFFSLIISLFALTCEDIGGKWFKNVSVTLTQNVYHIFLPLLQITLYESSLLDASKVWTIRHFFETTDDTSSTRHWTDNDEIDSLLATICDGLTSAWFICNSVFGKSWIEIRIKTTSTLGQPECPL